MLHETSQTHMCKPTLQAHFARSGQPKIVLFSQNYKFSSLRVYKSHSVFYDKRDMVISQAGALVHKYSRTSRVRHLLQLDKKLLHEYSTTENT